MPETVDFYIKSVVDLWNEQAISAPNGVWPGAETSPRKIARPFMEAYKRRIGGLTTASKFHGLRITEGYNAQGFKRMMKSFWTRNYVHQKNRRKLNGLDRLKLSWTHAFEFSDAPVQFTLGIVPLMLQGKTNKSSQQNYGVVVRNKDVHICAVGSLAFYMLDWDISSMLAPEKYTHPTNSVSAANLRDWLLTIEDVMMDRNKKVILQDAATLMDLDDPDCDYSQHHIFRAPVFKTPHFMEFRNEFREAARNDMSPITEILAANAPAMHRELWSMNTRLTALDSKLETGLLRQLDQSMEHHQNVMSKSM
ncbi:hypothetical protein BGZ58_004458, partial [Dissophora ornata]